MRDKVQWTVYLEPEVDDELGNVAYNLKLNKVEVIKKLIEKGLDEGILEDLEENGR